MDTKILPLALFALSQGVYAAQPPGAGTQLRQIPPTPQLKKPPPEIRIQQGATPVAAADDGTKITVNSVQISGQSLFTSPEWACY